MSRHASTDMWKVTQDSIVKTSRKCYRTPNGIGASLFLSDEPHELGIETHELILINEVAITANVRPNADSCHLHGVEMAFTNDFVFTSAPGSV